MNKNSQYLNFGLEQYYNYISKSIPQSCSKYIMHNIQDHPTKLQEIF
jgi:hypothetical protein